jgi:hypothetical protein
MPTALLKSDHPCFFDFSESNHAGDGFRLHGGLFYLFRSADIFSGPRDDFFADPRSGTLRYSRPDPESNADKCKMLLHTIDIGFEETAKQTCLRSCKRPEDGLDMNLTGGLPVVCGSSFFQSPKLALRAFSICAGIKY